MTRTFYSSHFKRMLDLFGVFLAFLLLWPCFLLLYCLLRFSNGAPVLFRQTRPGFQGKPFTIYKFRTMGDQRGIDGKVLPDNFRITRIGRIVRGWSLDELPELFNVLKGEMSFVGPRPLMIQYLERYTLEQARRHEVLPGITGWAQINGRNTLTWEEKFALDVWYVEHQCITLDLSILGRTVWKVLLRDGISQEGYVAASEFMGSNPRISKQADHV